MFQCLNVKSGVVNPSTVFCSKGEEEKEEEDRREENVQEKNYTPFLDNKEQTFKIGLPWQFYCRCMFYVPYSVFDISMLLRSCITVYCRI